jgi:galactoside O-acetyltransferase
VSAYVTVVGGKESGLWLKGFNTIGPHTAMLCASDRFSGSGLVSVTIPREYRDIVDEGTIIVEEFANIGSNVVVMPKVHIGEGAVIGANSFVNRDLDPWGVYVGTPVRKIRDRPSQIMKDAARKVRRL